MEVTIVRGGGGDGHGQRNTNKKDSVSSEQYAII